MALTKIKGLDIDESTIDAYNIAPSPSILEKISDDSISVGSAVTLSKDLRVFFHGSGNTVYAQFGPNSDYGLTINAMGVADGVPDMFAIYSRRASNNRGSILLGDTTVSGGLYIDSSSDMLTWKNNQIWHSGNINPVSKTGDIMTGSLTLPGTFGSGLQFSSDDYNYISMTSPGGALRINVNGEAGSEYALQIDADKTATFAGDLRLGGELTSLGGASFTDRVNITNSSYGNHLRLVRSGALTVDITPSTIHDGGVSITLENTPGFGAESRLFWGKRDGQMVLLIGDQHEVLHKGNFKNQFKGATLIIPGGQKDIIWQHQYGSQNYFVAIGSRNTSRHIGWDEKGTNSIRFYIDQIHERDVEFDVILLGY